MPEVFVRETKVNPQKQKRKIRRNENNEHIKTLLSAVAAVAVSFASAAVLKRQINAHRAQGAQG